MHSSLLGGLPSVVRVGGAPSIRDFWGVDQSATVTASDGKIYERILYEYEYLGNQYRVLRHPQLLICQDVYNWYESYIATEYCSMPNYLELTPLWMDCERIYRKYLGFFKSQVKER